MAPVLSLLLLPLAVNGFTIPLTQKRNITYTPTKQSLNATRHPSPLDVVDSIATITRTKAVSSRSSPLLYNMHTGNNKKKKTHGEAHVEQLTYSDFRYLVDVTVDGEKMKLIMNTGVTDTWFLKNGFNCIGSNGQSIPSSECKFGPTYNGTLDNTIPNELFDITYPDGTSVQGNTGFKDVRIGNIKVSQAQICLVDTLYTEGYPSASGQLGLAYSGATFVYKHNDKEKSRHFVPYDTILTKMVQQNGSTPVFSIALNRNLGGIIAFGGLPPVRTSTKFATTPIEMLRGDYGLLLNKYTFYVFTPEAILYKDSPTKQKAQYIIDTGLVVNRVPTSDAKAINSLFSPPAKLDKHGRYMVSCNAKVPAIAIKIGGVTFQINSRDMLVHETPEQCISAFQDGHDGPFMLGQAFMHNVVTVFDFGASLLRFSQRTN